MIPSDHDAFFTIDWNNLFVSSTLENELLLFAPDFATSLHRIQSICTEFGLQIDPKRYLNTYSGGEQAIICCAFVCTLLPDKAVNILFVHVLETLSPTNRLKIRKLFHMTMSQARLFTQEAAGPAPLVSHA